MLERRLLRLKRLAVDPSLVRDPHSATGQHFHYDTETVQVIDQTPDQALRLDELLEWLRDHLPGLCAETGSPEVPVDNFFNAFEDEDGSPLQDLDVAQRRQRISPIKACELGRSHHTSESVITRLVDLQGAAGGQEHLGGAYRGAAVESATQRKD